MNERARRLWAGAEAEAMGYGGVIAVARATGLAIRTVHKGRDEARAGAKPEDVVKVRRSAKSTYKLSAEMLALHGISLCDQTVAKLLREHGYSLQAPNKSVEGTQHPDRNAQFEHINAKAQDCVERGVPVISVDTEEGADRQLQERRPRVAADGSARPGGRPRLSV